MAFLSQFQAVDFLSNFFSYLSWFQIVLLMVGLMSGIFSLFREVVLINHPEKSKDHHLFFRCVMIAFILSAIWLWISEHSQTLALRSKLDDLTQPQLNASFGESIGPLPSNPKDSVLVVVGTIKNKGAATVLDSWKLNVKLNDGRSVDAVLAIQPTLEQSVTMFNPTTGKSDPLPASEQWVRKTKENPIIRGGAAMGWLASQVPGISQDQFEARKAVFTLSCNDINGRTWTFTDTIDSNQGRHTINMNDIFQYSVPPTAPTTTNRNLNTLKARKRPKTLNAE